MQQAVLVLGANGRFGRVVAKAFAEAGWRVLAQARKPLADSDNARLAPLIIPITDRDGIIKAAADAAVVVNAMNPLYTAWESEALALNDAAIGIARALGATLMLPGNVYNFGAAMPAELTEQTPQLPTNRKGEIRIAMEAAMRAGAPRSIVVRAGDFFGGPGAGSWFDLAVVKELAAGKITYPGPRNLEHAWAYLPDLGRTFVLLAQAREHLALHESFHFPGHTLTGDQLVAGIARASWHRGILPGGRAPIIKTMPWGLLRIAGLVNPMLRELVRMSYLWRQPHRLAGAKLAQAIGAVPHTALDDALGLALAELGISPVSAGSAVARAA